jgi:hypothetical protein
VEYTLLLMFSMSKIKVIHALGQLCCPLDGVSIDKHESRHRTVSFIPKHVQIVKCYCSFITKIIFAQSSIYIYHL